MKYRYRAAKILDAEWLLSLRAPADIGSGPLNCQELATFLDDFLDGHLPSAYRKIFERHLAECVPCEEYLIAYAKTSRMVKDVLCGPSLLEGEEVPPELVRTINAAFLEWRSGAEQPSGAAPGLPTRML